MLTKLQRLANTARVDDSDGFTLIELLIVVVIIGILAAIAIPQFSSTKESAYDASAKADLRNLMTTQEAYFASEGEYGDINQADAGEPIVVGSSPADSVQASSGVVVDGGTVGGTDAWTATASHTSSDNTFCVAINTGSTQGQIYNLDTGTCG